MPTPLLATKLFIPPPGKNLVARPRLLDKLDEGLHPDCRLTLVCAPAGFGKTTLVGSWIANLSFTEKPPSIAWLSLDDRENDTVLFWSYIISALQTIKDGFGSKALVFLKSAPSPDLGQFLSLLINEMVEDPVPSVLVLDDYHLVRNPEIHESLSSLTEHSPAGFHLLIISRTDPPLPLALLRGRGQLVEIRLSDLRFSNEEAYAYLHAGMKLILQKIDVETLNSKTEGWAAGLQMAALSMRDRKDVSGFIEGFSGTNRFILDYLLEQVLAGQSPEIQHFLLYTSILERLTVPLCEAILAENEGAKRQGVDGSTGSESFFVGRSTSILEYLVRANLFLVPLDDERIWYRYHHLFADLLRAQLQRSLGAQGVAQLHIRASDWHAQNGSIQEAISHASLASDDERVERYIEQNYMELVSRGEQSWLRLWIVKLSKELVYSRPWLCIYEAYSHSWFGELDEADLLLEQAEKRTRSEISAPDAHAMMGQLAYVKSRVTAMRGDLQRAIEFCLEARKYVPAGNLALQLDSRITLGYEYFLIGDYVNASQVLNEMIRSGITAGAVINTVAASCVMARLYAVQGLLNKSYEMYRTAAKSIPEASGQHLGARALVEVGLADIFCERNDLEAALVHLQQGLDLLPFWGKADDSALAYITLARIHLAQAKKRDALEAVEKALQVIRTSGVFPEARKAVEIAQVKLWLAQGDLQAADRWAASQEQSSGSDERFRFEKELTHITKSRVLIAQERFDEAIGYLSHLEGTARSAGRMGRVVEILLLEASAHGEMGDSEHAILALTDCLTLAEPNGYVRIFLDEGQPMQRLLAQWLGHAGASPLRDYVIHLLSQYEAEQHTLPTVQEKVSLAGHLVEPLSQRELEVLGSIAAGLTNKEIAQKLFISLRTVKYHTTSIFNKLNVNNRAHAAAKARELGLLK